MGAAGPFGNREGNLPLLAKRSSARLLHLIDSLFERPILTVPEAAKALEVTYSAAQRNVRKLVDAGILREIPGTSNPQLLVAQEIVAIAGSADVGD